MSDKQPGCAERVYGSHANFGGSPCSRTGRHEEDGQRWCGQHRPSAVAARRKKANDEWATKMARRDARDKAAAAERKRLAGLDAENAALTEQVAELQSRPEYSHEATELWHKAQTEVGRLRDLPEKLRAVAFLSNDHEKGYTAGLKEAARLIEAALAPAATLEGANDE